MGMVCEEKTNLVSEFEAATKTFAEAVTELQHKMGTSPRIEYETLSRATNEARLKSEQARLALEHHIATHGC
jgi:hypothetical protein